jgi:hypothetical protein
LSPEAYLLYPVSTNEFSYPTILGSPDWLAVERDAGRLDFTAQITRG